MSESKPRRGRSKTSRAAGEGSSTVPKAAPDSAEASESSRGISARTPDEGGDHTLEQALESLSVDHATAERIQKLPHDIGWLLVTAGVVGMVMPGVLGTPFLVLGGLILMPATSQRAEHWLAGHSPRIFKGSIRQINRFLDDLERRYPRRG